MPLSYADAIKKRNGEKRSQETTKSKKKDAVTSPTYAKLNLHLTGTSMGPSFPDIGIQKVRENSKQEMSIQEHDNRTKKSKVSGSATGLRTWKNIADKRSASSGSPVLGHTPVQNTNRRRGKRKDINGNASVLPQKSSKPKPSLRSYSISDLIEPAGKAKGPVDSVAVLSKSGQPQTKSTAKFPALSSSSNPKSPKPPTKWRPPETRAPVRGTNPGDQAILNVKSKRAANKKQTKKHTSNSDAASSLATMFLQPRGFDERAQDGEEHQLFRLMQERTVYKKKGRQRVAPRKKKLTALKKKVLHERLRKWQERCPEQSAKGGKSRSNHASDNTQSGVFRSICLYHFVDRADLEEDDEFEEVEQNLQEMASKIASVDELLVPRGLDRRGEYPVFVRFKTVEGAIAAKACWDGLVIAGDVLSAVFINDTGLDDISDWSAGMITAEGKGEFSQMKNESKPDDRMTAIVIEGVLSQDDYDDNDCMEESLSFLKHAAAKYANVSIIQPSNERDGNAVLFCTGDSSTAQMVVHGLSSTVIAGKRLSASVLETNGHTMDPISFSLIVLENLLTQDDFDDKECFEETLNDVKELIEKYGKVAGIKSEGSEVQICFVGNVSDAREAVGEMNRLVLGGAAVSARLEAISGRSILLRNALSEDDMDDDDCFEESLKDIRQIMSKYGEISGLNAFRNQNVVVVDFVLDTSDPSMSRIAAELNGSIIGGQIISASTSRPSALETLVVDNPTPPEAKQTCPEAKKPIYSGDKLIPEFFAECKRVPKIPNPTGPRNYAQVTNDEQVRPLLAGMLGELMRLQKRAIEDKNAKARRRLVLGLREVCRGIRAHKVKMVVMANNLDEYGAIDEKLQEIIDLARAEGIPLFFEFTKRSLGKALGKTIKVAVVGIQNADGAHREFKELTAIQKRYNHE